MSTLTFTFSVAVPLHDDLPFGSVATVALPMVDDQE